MTATANSFTFVYCFVRQKKKEYYMWTLNKIKKIFNNLSVFQQFLSQIENLR